MWQSSAKAGAAATLAAAATTRLRGVKRGGTGGILFPTGERRGEAEADEGGAGEAPLKALKTSIAAQPVGKAARRQGIGAVAEDAQRHEDRAQSEDLPVDPAQG